MVKYKYNVGDRIGPWDILFVERLTETVDSRNRQPYGLFECPGCGQVIKTRIQTVAKGQFHWCKRCRSKVRQKRWIGNKLGQMNGHDLKGKVFNSWTVLEKANEIQNGHLVWICQCKCGNISKVTTGNLIQGISTQCVECAWKNPLSKGEKKIQTILEENEFTYKKEKTFEGCKFKNKLRFDFYLPDYNCCIEYDGEQHFKEKVLCPDSLDERQQRDEIKNQYCKDNGIKLIRIPYWDYDKLNNEFLLPLILGGDIGDARF